MKRKSRKGWLLSGIILVIVGVAGLAATGWQTSDKLPEFTKEWTFNSENLKTLAIKSDYKTEVIFAKSTDGTSTISVKGQAPAKTIDEIQAASLTDGHLLIDLREKPKRWINLFDFTSLSSKEQIIVMLADTAQLEKLEADLSSSNLTIKGARANEINLSLNSGSLSLSDLKADSLRISVDSGSVHGDVLDSESNITVQSGSIKLEHVKGNTTLSAASGSIKLYRDDTSNTDIKSNSGSVYVQLPSSFAGYFDLKTSSGSIHAPEAKHDTKDYVKARVSSGSVKIELQK